jgi:uncharacterized protein (DUF736 family)
MPQIGTFTRTANGYSGQLKTLTLDLELTLAATDDGEAANLPDYRIHLGSDDEGPEVGAAWKRTGEKAGDYLSLLIDDPIFTHPIRANLFQSDAKGKSFHLLWTRPSKRKEGR